MTDSGLENPHFLFLAFLLNGGFAFYSWSLFLVFKSQVNLKSKNHKKDKDWQISILVHLLLAIIQMKWQVPCKTFLVFS